MIDALFITAKDGSVVAKKSFRKLQLDDIMHKFKEKREEKTVNFENSEILGRRERKSLRPRRALRGVSVDK